MTQKNSESEISMTRESQSQFRHFNGRTQYSKDDWETPQYFFDLLNNKYHFTLDPCASPENAKCDKFYTINEDGLSKNWEGERVFVNPPFFDKARWIRKCYEEAQKENTLVVLIIPATTDTRAWHDYIMKAREIYFVKGRVNFIRPDQTEKSKSSSTFPLAVIVFEKKEDPSDPPRVFSLEHKNFREKYESTKQEEHKNENSKYQNITHFL